MASLLKPWVVRYLDADGRQVTKMTPDASKVKERTAKWYGQYTDSAGRKRRVPLCTDKAAARQMLAAIEREVQRGKVGLVDPFAEHRKLPIRDHLAHYETHLHNKGVSDKFRRLTLGRIRAVFDRGKVRTLADLGVEVVEDFLSFKADQGVGASTRNTYLLSAKAFVHWCLKTRRMGDDILSCLRCTTGEIRRQRRALTGEELVRLLSAARRRPLLEAQTIRRGPRKGHQVGVIRSPGRRTERERLGLERALVYKTLVYTGLRLGELGRLEVRHLTLDGPRPSLALPAALAKNRKDADLPLRADLVQDLKRWVTETGVVGTDRVFRVPSNLNAILKRDLKLAGIAFRDEQGRTVDVHALRHTTATHLGKAKVTPRVAQGFMRHADIKLTMQTYMDHRLLDESEALAALPYLPLSDGDGPSDAAG